MHDTAYIELIYVEIYNINIQYKLVRCLTVVCPMKAAWKSHTHINAVNDIVRYRGVSGVRHFARSVSSVPNLLYVYCLDLI